MFVSRGCRRCGGGLIEVETEDGTEVRCAACGRGPEAAKAPTKRARRQTGSPCFGKPLERVGASIRTAIGPPGWQPTCAHEAEPVHATVLDPFVGSGTAGVVAVNLGRDFIGIDLSEDYLAIARKRLTKEAAIANTVEAVTGQESAQLALPLSAVAQRRDA